MKTSDKNIDKKQQAQLLYITQGKTHAEIATEVGVTERTVFNWVHQYAWDKLRLAAYQAPVSIANSLCEEIVELQQNIALRAAGQRFPTPHESLTMQRMVSCLDKMKKYPSLSQNMQVLESFKNYIKPLDKEFSKTLGNYTNRYLSSAAQNGFVPYQLEYGIDAAPPLAPYYDEEETETAEPSASTWHPDDPVNYTIPGLHHARPYLIPLMHICYDQLVEDQQRAEAMADYYEQHCSTTDTDPEIVSSPNHQNDPEIAKIENDSENTDDTHEPKAEISGSDPEMTQPSEASRSVPGSPRRLASETQQIQSTLPEVSGNDPEITQTGNAFISPRQLVEASRFVPQSRKRPASETQQIQTTPPEISGNDPEITQTENAFISTRLEDFLTATSGKQNEPGKSKQRDGSENDQEKALLEKWNEFVQLASTGNIGPETYSPLNKAS